MVVIDDLHVSWFGNMHYDYVGEQEVDFDIIYFGEQKCDVPQANHYQSIVSSIPERCMLSGDVFRHKAYDGTPFA